MIGRLTGILLEKQPPHLLVDVNGVGYEVEAPMSTFYQLPAVGERVTLHTHLIVREDAQLLCGFATPLERQLFRHLIKVNSVGAKLALTILSGISASEFARCVQQKDAASLTRLPGVGKKTAERLIIEMRDRLDDMPVELLPQTAEAAAGNAPSNTAERDALSALVALGYKPQEASRLLQHVDTQGLESEAIIRLALKAAAS
ncbi:MAG: Holliday junction branch migration protein RuvA [Gammaproteobacteria bacterium]|nr:Holliday junction branch migration protein RuvA [Gammaproteobacteria bacterium]